MVHMYVLRTLQCTEVGSNWPGVSTREELRLYPLKAKKDSTSLVLRSLVSRYFQ